MLSNTQVSATASEPDTELTKVIHLKQLNDITVKSEKVKNKVQGLFSLMEEISQQCRDISGLVSSLHV